MAKKGTYPNTNMTKGPAGTTKVASTVKTIKPVSPKVKKKNF